MHVARKGVEQHPCRTLGPKMVFKSYVLQWSHAHQTISFLGTFCGSSGPTGDQYHTTTFFDDPRGLSFAGVLGWCKAQIKCSKWLQHDEAEECK